MRRLLWIVAVLVLGTAACQLKTKQEQPADSVRSQSDTATRYKLELVEAPANLGKLNLNLAQVGPFHARFVLEFEGETDWVYQVATRFDGTNTEYQLIVDGLENNLDLGDVRLVNSFEHNFMSGPATGDVCFQFPDYFETEPLFLGPQDFIHLSELDPLPEQSGSQTIVGREAARYTAAPGYHLGWQDVTINFWVDPQTDTVLKYEFFATGNDPLYFKGDGKVHGLFEVLEIGPQQIEAIPNCVIDFPLPDDASGLIRFPGLISFQTLIKPAKLDQFFTKALKPEGWTRQKPEKNAQTKDEVLEFTSQDDLILIHIAPLNLEDLTQGYLVEIYFED